MNEHEIRDTIREKANGIPLPDSLQPDQVEQRIEHAVQKKSRFSKRTKAILATAAGFAVLCVAGLGLVPYFSGASKTADSDSAAVENGTASASYAEICEVINDYYTVDSSGFGGWTVTDTTTNTAEDAAMASSAESEAPQGSSSPTAKESDYSETDTQVDGIMEGDIVKTDGSHIFTIKNSTTGCTVTIYGAEGADVNHLSEIKVSEANLGELYVEGTTLVLAGTLWGESPNPINKYEEYEDDIEVAEYHGGEDTGSYIELYDISDPASPRQIHRLTQSGSFRTSRLSNGYLYTFTNHVVSAGKYDKDKPGEFVPKVNDETMAADRIHLLNRNRPNSYMVMTSLNVRDGSTFTDSVAILGNFDTHYMNQNHIYAVDSSYWWDVNASNPTIIAKYTYENGKFAFDATAKVRGQIADSYYMHEYQDNFVFVYTRNDEVATNGLCVMDRDLKLLGEISDLGINETIYSSYYIDNMAYFVTYRNTDPVFAVDISNPRKPVLKSELKLPGFSSYLHSFGEDMLIGIGSGSKDSDDENQGENRVKISLFSIGRDNQLKEVGKKLEALYTNSYAAQNHKAVFVDGERGLIGLGINHYMPDGKSEYVIYQARGGALTKVLSVPISLRSQAAYVRGVRIGEYFYVVDVQGEVEVFDINTWKKAKKR